MTQQSMDREPNPHVVDDRESFLDFVRDLAIDRSAAAKAEFENSDKPYKTFRGWQNSEIDTFLECAVAWAEVHGFFRSPKPSWRAFAEFLYAGKIYE